MFCLEPGKAKTKAKAKCGGLSTAQQTMRLSVASVEMTQFFLHGRDDAVFSARSR